MRIFILICLITLISGCAGPRALKGEQLQSIGNAWNEKVQKMAKETFLYALLSREVYSCDPSVIANGVRRVECKMGRRGFAYSIYERSKENMPETIVVFRGTEGGFVDLWHGNLLGRQNKLGLVLVKDLRSKLGSDAKISVAGNSLGGGIATHVSINMPKIDAYVFNTSPRFWKKSKLKTSMMKPNAFQLLNTEIL